MPSTAVIACRAMSSAIDRLLLQRIPTHPERISTSALHETLAGTGHVLTPRAVQKRLVELQRQHGLLRDDRSKPHQWSWPKGAKQKLFATMAPHEALALVLARDHMKPLLPPRTMQWMDDRLMQSERELGADLSGKPNRWRSKVRRVPLELPRHPKAPDARVFRHVSEALYEGQQLSLRYNKRFEPAPLDYVVHPLGLCEREGELWLVARKQEESGPGGLRFFLLHRMLEARVLRGRPVVPPPGFDLDRAIAEGLAHFPLELGNHMTLRARFHADVVEKLLESPLSLDQKITQLPSGWWRLQASVPHTRALQAFLLSYGPMCVVESPAPLRDAIVREHVAAAEAYRS